MANVQDKSSYWCTGVQLHGLSGTHSHHVDCMLL